MVCHSYKRPNVKISKKNINKMTAAWFWYWFFNTANGINTAINNKVNSFKEQ